MTLIVEPPTSPSTEPRMTQEAAQALDDAVAAYRRNLVSLSRRRKEHELIVEDDVLGAAEQLGRSRRLRWSHGLALLAGGFSVSSFAALLTDATTQSVTPISVILPAAGVVVALVFAFVAERSHKKEGDR